MMQQQPGDKIVNFPGGHMRLVLTPKTLGKGQYGSVHLSYQQNEHSKFFAVKVVDKRKIKGRLQDLLQNEMRLLEEIRDTNVVQLKTATKTNNNYYLVMEFCNGGDLGEFIKFRGGHLQESDARVILRQIVKGLQAIRIKKVMHRDLKLPNILLNLPGLSPQEFISPNFNLKNQMRSLKLTGPGAVNLEVKIADLGFARELEEEDLASTRLGTPLIMAPETLAGEKFDHSVDVWSLGCVFYEMLTGFSPFTGTSQLNLHENIVKGDYKFPKTVKFSLQGLSFLNMCLQFDPKKRPSIFELASHPYLQLDELETSKQEDLFLSFHPDSRKFYADKLVNGEACIGQGSHAKVLQGNPHQWLAQNPNEVISLNVHGSGSYEQVVQDCLQKLQDTFSKVPQKQQEKPAEEVKFEPNLLDDGNMIDTQYFLPKDLEESYVTAANELVSDGRPLNAEQVSPSFVPGDKNIDESVTKLQDSMVNLMETSNFNLITDSKEVSVTNHVSNNKPLTKANIGLKLNFF